MQLSRKKKTSKSLSLKSRYSKDFHRNWQLYAMVSVPVIYVLIFSYFPMYGLQIAFRNYNALDGILGSEFVGLAWFKKFFNSPWFWTYVGNTLKISIYNNGMQRYNNVNGYINKSLCYTVEPQESITFFRRMEFHY